MASITKLSRDKKRKNAPYYIQFVDHEGNRRTTKGCSDRGVTQSKAARIEIVVQQIKLGTADVPELDDLLGKKRQSEGLSEYLDNFEQSLINKDNTAKHVRLTMSRVRTVVKGCNYTTLDDIDADAAERFVIEHCNKDKLGHRTYNHYLQALDSFGNWLSHPKRRVLERNPFAGIPRRNTQTDIRRKRRALSPEEITKVINTARASDYKVQCYNGKLRARLYLLSYMTGLRKGEIASLTPLSFDLEATQPTVTVEARDSKHRKKDTLPLHGELVGMIGEWVQGMAPDEALFPRLKQRKAYFMIQRDLEEAGIPYETEDGVADFHAAGRHTHITQLLMSGVKLVEAKELARHSDVRMTMKYTHVRLEDQAKAVNLLPSLDLPAGDAEDECLHIVCTESGADRQNGALTDISRHEGTSKKKRRNSQSSKEFGAVQQPSAQGGTERQKMEAAGIEPASRDISTQASTCVVDKFNFGRRDA